MTMMRHSLGPTIFKPCGSAAACRCQAQEGSQRKVPVYVAKDC